MLSSLLFVSLLLLALSIVGCLYRVLKGPSMADRITALDTIGVMLLAFIAVLSMMLRTEAYFEVILLIGIITFLGTTAFAKFIERGAVLDRGRNNRDDR